MTARTTAPPGREQDRRAASQALEALAPLERGDHRIQVGRSTLRVSNLDKVLFARSQTTKLELLRAYAALAPALLTHARGRAMTMRRWPDGVDGEWFYQKRVPEGHPDWVHVTEPLGDKGVRYCVVDDVRTLLWAANLAAIELHVPLAKAEHPMQPNSVVFDLDPGVGTGIIECCQVAGLIDELLDDLGLDAHAKTSGSKGLQLYVPLDASHATFNQTRAFARAVAELLESRHPAQVIARQSRKLRTGRVLIDWMQNYDSKTTVCAYSIRATPQPRVSTPVTWDEVRDTAHGSDAEALRFDPQDVVDRLTKDGDLFAPLVRSRQRLPELKA